MELKGLRAGVSGLDVALTEYIKYKKDENGFQEYVNTRVKQVENEQQGK